MDWKRLLWWLGPWCNQDRAPKGVVYSDHTIATEEDAEDFRFRIYRSQRQYVSVMVLPGLQPEGLDDLRLDRFCRVLADAGAVVGIPELPTMKRSIMARSVIAETVVAAQFFRKMIQGEHQDSFGVFCISASSIAGLHLVQHPEVGRFVHRIHLFGGFADWREALRFAMTGRIEGVKQVEVDPLSLPVVYMNLLCVFPNFIEQRLQLPQTMKDCLVTYIHRYVANTWEKPHLKHPEDTRTIAETLYQEMEQEMLVKAVDRHHLRAVWMKLCAVEDGGHQPVHQFLDGLSGSLDGPLQWLHPQPLLQHFPIVLDISHGRDDVVVPHPQALQLGKWSPSNVTNLFVTGLYHHTGVVSKGRLLAMLLGLPKELWTSIQMVRALSRLGDADQFLKK